MTKVEAARIRLAIDKYDRDTNGVWDGDIPPFPDELIDLLEDMTEAVLGRRKFCRACYGTGVRHNRTWKEYERICSRCNGTHYEAGHNPAVVFKGCDP